MTLRIVATSAYVPATRLGLNELLDPRTLRSPVPEWEATCELTKHIFAMHGYDADAVCDAVATVSAVELRGRAGLGQVAVERELRMPEMCVTAMRRLLEAAPAAPPQAIVLCQTSLDNDHNTNVSSVLRLQCELGLNTGAFAIGSQDAVSPFIALGLLRDMFKTDPGLQRAMLCSVERWREPYPRVIGALTLLGDGAAAWLLEPGDGPGWHVLDVRSSTQALPGFAEPWCYLLGQASVPDFAAPVADLILSMLAERRMQGSDLKWTLPPHFNRSVLARVEALCGMRGEQRGPSDFGEHGYLCTVEPLLRLHELRQSPQLRDGDLALAWVCGFEGACAAALFQYRDVVATPSTQTH